MEYQKEYYENNKEQIKEKQKEYYENNKKQVLEKQKEYNEKNKEQIKEYIKEYNEKNKEQIKEYKKEYRKEYNEKNKEQIKEYRKEYNEKKKDKIKEKQKQYNKKNKDKIKEKQKEYNENNKEKRKEYNETNKDKIKEYNETNKDKIKEKQKEYYENNKEKIQEYNKEYNKCKSCKLFLVKKKTNYLCSYCNPDKATKQKTKEMAVKTFLEENNYTFIHNKKCNLNDICQTYFPDFVIDCNTFFVILECDEYAHKSYEYDCERIRENNICFALGLPCVFLRYNPDKKDVEMQTKQKVLKSYIEYYINKKTCDNVVEFLFY